MIVKDDYQWMVHSQTTATPGWQEDEISKCKFRVRADGFRNNAFVYCMQQYKAVKINWIKYSISCTSVSYNFQFTNLKQEAEQKFRTGYGITDVKKIPIHVLWNANLDIPANPSSNVIKDSTHSKVMYPGGRPVNFVYSVPKNKRAYVDCSYMYQTADPTTTAYNTLCSFLGKFDMCPCGPSFFFATDGGVIGELNKYISPEGMTYIPIKYFFTVKTLISATFKGYNDVVYSFNSQALFAKTGGSKYGHEGDLV